MKITKRIIVAVLALAILVSAFVFVTSADEEFANAGQYGINDIEGILEYYDLDDYLSDNYETGAYNTNLYLGTPTPTIVADPTNPDNKVLKVALGSRTGSSSYSNASSTDKLIVSYRIYFEPGVEGVCNYKLNVRRVNDRGVEDLTYTTILSIDFKTQLTKTETVDNGDGTFSEVTTDVVDEEGKPVYGGLFKYSIWDQTGNNGAGAFREAIFEGINPKAGQWYDIVIFFNAGEGSYNFKISDDAGESWHNSEMIDLGNTSRMSSFQLLVAEKERKVVEFYLDDVEIYCGTFERNPANKNLITSATLVDLAKIYESASDYETRLRVADVMYRLTSENCYGYVPTEAGNAYYADAMEVMKKIPEYVNSVFATEFLSQVEKISASSGYYARIAQNQIIDYYNVALPAAEADGIDADLAAKIAEARETFAAELKDMEIVKAHSDAFIKHMYGYDPENKDYDNYLKGFYEFTETLNKRDDTYREAVEGCDDFGMEDAIATFASYNARIEKMLAALNTFIGGVNEMMTAVEGVEDLKAAGVAEWFGPLYNGYETALSVYNNGVIDETLDNSTHAELSAKIAEYLKLEPYILGEKKLCDEFNHIIKCAKTATYYTTIIEYLKEAEPYYDIVQTGYRGVVTSKNLYDSLTKAIAEDEDASKAYINAVKAIAEAETFAEKYAAVEAARALKASGDVLGIDGVKEANVIFSVAAGEIDFLVNNSNTLISLVSKLEDATTITERRTIIRQAMEIRGNAESTYEGVAEAQTALDKEIEAFNAEVAAMNQAMIQAAGNAVTVSGATANDSFVNKFINIIKDMISR